MNWKNEKIAEYIRDEWNPDDGRQYLFAVAREVFEQIAYLPKVNGRNVAIISIENTDNYIDFAHQHESHQDDSNEHILLSSDRVLNIDFDDVSKRHEIDGFVIDCITEEQGKEIIDFVKRNIDKSIIVHCAAGLSRSQGVVRALSDLFPDRFDSCYVNEANPCETPNIEVVRVIKRAYGEKY